MEQEDSGITIIYDKECPVCVSYLKYGKLKNFFSNIQLINYRENSEIYEKYKSRGIDINNGMVLIINDKEYYASEAFFLIKNLFPENLYYAKILKFFIPNKTIDYYVYPVLVRMRKLFLFLIRKNLRQ